MIALGYFGAAVMGVTLGLLGGGGSILAVLIFAYLFNVSATAATYYSLFIVGVCSAIGVIPFAQRRLVEVKTALLFFVPAAIGVFFSRRIILPRLPENKDMIILVAFAIVMLAASWSMIRKKAPAKIHMKKNHLGRITLNGVGVGIATGFVGAGGGFLIVPALVNGIGLSMEKAVGTSLFIIALNSLSGFTGDLIAGIPVQWNLVLPFLCVALVGMVAGTHLNRFVSSIKLKSIFGWFVLTLGSLIIIKQFLELTDF
ncbi:MAG: sulfite exporter TauE/SafE family protein [Bdellovibrionota bacterium]